ncbi:hypothetical protein [Bradyrhizobium sp. S69]|uniref:hypothetical protein n=1 Tax=Bradyrhizobium sp. S69 TaxID=1641856 RepID=UPI00131CF7E2|nr:hypothetical protein [Bradyrhizobium sp. S69]
MDNSNITRATHLTEAERIDWLRLIRSDNVGPRGIMAQTPPGYLRTTLADRVHRSVGDS